MVVFLEEVLTNKLLFSKIKHKEVKQMNIYTTKEVCEKYKITRQTFYSWIKQGLKIIQVTRMIRITEEDLEEFINKNKQK